MRVLFQRLFSTLVLLGLLAGALVWNREAGYYGLVCIFCILTAWEWRHMLIRSGKAGQARLSFLFGAAYPVLLSVACFFNKFRLTMRDEFRMMPDPLLLVVAAPVILVVVAFIREMNRPVVGSRASAPSLPRCCLSFIRLAVRLRHSRHPSGLPGGGGRVSAHCDDGVVGDPGDEDDRYFRLRQRTAAGGKILH